MPPRHGVQVLERRSIVMLVSEWNSYLPGASLRRCCLKRASIPMPQIGRRFIGALKEREKLLLGVVRFSEGVVGQNEFAQCGVVARAGRAQRGAAEPFGLRIGIAVE